MGLVALILFMTGPSTYFHPNALLQWLLFNSQLDMLRISFAFVVIEDSVEPQLTHTLIMTPVTLPNLYPFIFQGYSSYLEGHFHRIATSRLEILEFDFFLDQRTFSVSLQFMNTTEGLKV